MFCMTKWLVLATVFLCAGAIASKELLYKKTRAIDNEISNAESSISGVNREIADIRLNGIVEASVIVWDKSSAKEDLEKVVSLRITQLVKDVDVNVSRGWLSENTAALIEEKNRMRAGSILRAERREIAEVSNMLRAGSNFRATIKAVFLRRVKTKNALNSLLGESKTNSFLAKYDQEIRK